MNQLNNKFNHCCDNVHKVKYDIKHYPKPMNFVPELRESIDRLLWYVPGIDSVQSYENYLIDDPLYSRAVFDIILEIMKMSRVQDVEILRNTYGKVPYIYKKYYDGEICTSCQKMILTFLDEKHNTTGKEETLVRAMLRHLRNSIAHGSFTVVNDFVLFKDYNTNKKITAILKINVLSLNEALKKIEDYKGITQERVIGKVFRNLGFNVEREVVIEQIYPDLILEKNGKIYAVEIKQSNQRTLEYQDILIENAITQLTKYKACGLIPIFIYDKMMASDRAKDRLKNEGIILLDRKDIGELVEMNDIIS